MTKHKENKNKNKEGKLKIKKENNLKRQKWAKGKNKK